MNPARFLTTWVLGLHLAVALILLRAAVRAVLAHFFNWGRW